MTTAVADSTVLIYLSKLEELPLLRAGFGEVLVPDAVYAEVVERGRAEGYHDAVRVDEAVGSTLAVAALEGDARERAGALRERAGLGRGEAEAVALAEAVGGRCLTDDHAARRTARSIGVRVGGTVFVLLSGLDRGAFPFDGYVSRLDRLTERGFRMDATLYREAVEAGRAVVEGRDS